MTKLRSCRVKEIGAVKGAPFNFGHMSCCIKRCTLPAKVANGAIDVFQLSDFSVSHFDGYDFVCFNPRLVSPTHVTLLPPDCHGYIYIGSSEKRNLKFENLKGLFEAVISLETKS